MIYLLFLLIFDSQSYVPSPSEDRQQFLEYPEAFVSVGRMVTLEVIPKH